MDKESETGELQESIDLGLPNTDPKRYSGRLKAYMVSRYKTG